MDNNFKVNIWITMHTSWCSLLVPFFSVTAYFIYATFQPKWGVRMYPTHHPCLWACIYISGFSWPSRSPLSSVLKTLVWLLILELTASHFSSASFHAAVASLPIMIPTPSFLWVTLFCLAGDVPCVGRCNSLQLTTHQFQTTWFPVSQQLPLHISSTPLLTNQVCNSHPCYWCLYICFCICVHHPGPQQETSNSKMQVREFSHGWKCFLPLTLWGSWCRQLLSSGWARIVSIIFSCIIVNLTQICKIWAGGPCLCLGYSKAVDDSWSAFSC